MTLPRLFILACVLAYPVTHAEEKPAGNATSDATKSAESSTPGYVTAEPFKVMSPCDASVHHVAPCFPMFKTAGGKKFFIGSPAAKAEEVRFLRALKERESSNFPRVFLTYQKKQER